MKKTILSSLLIVSSFFSATSSFAGGYELYGENQGMKTKEIPNGYYKVKASDSKRFEFVKFVQILPITNETIVDIADRFTMRDEPSKLEIYRYQRAIQNVFKENFNLHYDNEFVKQGHLIPYEKTLKDTYKETSILETKNRRYFQDTIARLMRMKNPPIMIPTAYYKHMNEFTKGAFEGQQAIVFYSKMNYPSKDSLPLVKSNYTGNEGYYMTGMNPSLKKANKKVNNENILTRYDVLVSAGGDGQNGLFSVDVVDKNQVVFYDIANHGTYTVLERVEPKDEYKPIKTKDVSGMIAEKIYSENN